MRMLIEDATRAAAPGSILTKMKHSSATMIRASLPLIAERGTLQTFDLKPSPRRLALARNMPTKVGR